MNSRKKFDPKMYQEKKRIYRTIQGHHRISKVYVWCEKRKVYDVPPVGKIYLAAKYEFGKDGRKRVFEQFDSIEDALEWQAGKLTEDKIALGGITFGGVVANWRRKKLELKAPATKVSYEKIIRLYFKSLMDLPMKAFNSKTVDSWIDTLKDPLGDFMKSPLRTSFRHELSLLSVILTFYREYEDNSFLHPVLNRHKEDVRTDRKKPSKNKNLTAAEFHHFLTELRKRPNGRIFAAMATVQYYQALRVSEVAALHWGDILWRENSPSECRLVVQRLIVFSKQRDIESFIQSGFKNSEANDGIKEQPIFPETYFALRSLFEGNPSGLIFHIEGKIFEYRHIQYAYDEAFKAAGLRFRGTHIMRHGGTRLAYNATGDLEVAKQLLGNRALQSVTIYAQRDAGALSQFAKERWDSQTSLIASDSKA